MRKIGLYLFTAIILFCGTYARNKEIQVPKKYPRVVRDMDGHYWQFIDACIAGYGNAEVDSPFEGYAGLLTETVLMGNLLLRSLITSILAVTAERANLGTFITATATSKTIAAECFSKQELKRK